MTAHVTVDQLVADICKKFGKGSLLRASDAWGLVKPRLSTGSFALDIVTDGGIPEGGISLYEGEEGSSKSFMAISAAKSFLNKHPEGVFILVNAEGTNDPPFLQMLGCDLTRSYLVQPNSGEEAWDIAHSIAEKAQKVFLVIDSLDAMTPLGELDSEMHENKMTLAARMNNRGFRKLVTLMRTDLESGSQRITSLFICQLRATIGVMYGDPLQTVGGKGKLFAATTRIRFRRVKRLKEDEKELVKRIHFGMEVEAEILKNKGLGEGEKVRYQLYTMPYSTFRRGEIDNITELVPFLLEYKIVETRGHHYHFPADIAGGVSIHGQEKLAEYLKSRRDVWPALMARVQKEHKSRRDPVPTAPTEKINLKRRAVKP